MRPTAAILLAGGKGTRFGADGNKAYAPVAGRPLISYSLSTLDRSPFVTDLFVVARPQDRQSVLAAIDICRLSKLRAIVDGGITRQQSEACGLDAVAQHRPETETVLIHDSARPFATHHLIEMLHQTAAESTGAIPALPVLKTLWRCETNPIRTANWNDLVRVQTPQAFDFGSLQAAFAQAERTRHQGLDTAQTVELLDDAAIRWVEGDERNFKVTNPEDQARAESLAVLWDNGVWADR